MSTRQNSIQRWVDSIFEYFRGFELCQGQSSSSCYEPGSGVTRPLAHNTIDGYTWDAQSRKSPETSR